jgi:hypothetical protein
MPAMGKRRLSAQWVQPRAHLTELCDIGILDDDRLGEINVQVGKVGQGRQRFLCEMTCPLDVERTRSLKLQKREGTCSLAVRMAAVVENPAAASCSERGGGVGAILLKRGGDGLPVGAAVGVLGHRSAPNVSAGGVAGIHADSHRQSLSLSKLARTVLAFTTWARHRSDTDGL